MFFSLKEHTNFFWENHVSYNDLVWWEHVDDIWGKMILSDGFSLSFFLNPYLSGSQEFLMLTNVLKDKIDINWEKREFFTKLF
jgi:hypothetical protein